MPYVILKCQMMGHALFYGKIITQLKQPSTREQTGQLMKYQTFSAEQTGQFQSNSKQVIIG